MAIRKGPWKAIFHQNGKRELFNLASDLSETDNVLSAQPDTVAQLTALLSDSIDRGRSTPGTVQTNEFALTVPVVKARPNKRNARAKTESK